MTCVRSRETGAAASALAGAGRSSFAGASEQELGQQRDRSRSCAFVLARAPGGARDVEVCPFIFAGEAREKAGRGNAAGGPAAYIGEIRKVAFQLILVIFPERHAPGAIIGRVGSLQKFVGELVIVREQPGSDLSKRD